LNLDLMFALPGQTLAMAEDDLQQAVALAPEHLSLYQLTLEPNTVFHQRPPAELPDDELSWDMQEAAFQHLQRAGYRRYEISAFARDGKRCRHNRNYWTFGDYLAVGAGAHGKVTDRAGLAWRYRKPAHPQTYMECAERDDLARHPSERIAESDLLFEFMLNALRLPDGFAESDFEDRTGLPFDVARPGVSELADRGLMEAAGASGWRPTALGLRFLNELQGHFLPSAEAIA
ncbi:MAG: coproporphyrinogen-III oxidase family protein, partial [Woeseia sp.]